MPAADGAVRANGRGHAIDVFDPRFEARGAVRDGGLAESGDVQIAQLANDGPIVDIGHGLSPEQGCGRDKGFGKAGRIAQRRKTAFNVSAMSPAISPMVAAPSHLRSAASRLKPPSLKP